ncbi:MAG: HDOD domain-containing protein [Thiobacillus sp.]|nr:HDOD domain-containing protein [Thiobacillus sp.]
MSDSQQLDIDDMNEALASIEIPACPAVLTRVMAEAQKDDPDINALSHIIASDVGMSAFAIKLANSALFRGSGPVNSVPKAVARLGIRNILCTVVAVSLRSNVIPGVPPEMLEQFWDRAGALALAASLAARKVHGVAPDLAYTYALFHDAAIPILMRRFPTYAKVMDSGSEGDRVAIENQHFQCNHAVAGAMLARNWGLSDVIARAIRFHHDREIYVPGQNFLPGEAMALVAIVHVAEYLMAEQGSEGYEGMVEQYEAAAAYLGLDEDDIQDIREAIGASLQ